MRERKDSSGVSDYSTIQLTGLVVLRILIGWHFLYEGIVKLLNPYWSSAGYLTESKWIFSRLFTSLAANPTLLAIIDFLNIIRAYGISNIA